MSPEDGLVAKIWEIKSRYASSISHKRLLSFLRCCEFLRFEKVELSYGGFGFKSIDRKCHLFVEHLKPLAAAFSDSTKIYFYACIGGGQGCSNFRDPLHLLNHLRNKLLPICDSARHYKFSISFLSYYESSASDILKSILQMPSINSSINVEFNLHQSLCALNLSVPPILTQLPVDTISAWLDRCNDVIIKCKKQQQKTKLELKIDLRGVQNVHELFEHFKKVHSFKKISLFNLNDKFTRGAQKARALGLRKHLYTFWKHTFLISCVQARS